MRTIAIPIPSRTRVLALLLLVLAAIVWIFWLVAWFMSSGEDGSARMERLEVATFWLLVAALTLTTFGLLARHVAPCWIVDPRRRRLRLPGGRSLSLSKVCDVTLSSSTTPFMDAAAITHEAESQFVSLHLENGEILRSGALGGVFAQAMVERLRIVLDLEDADADEVD